ncbi:MAG: hypothetical protein HPY53_04245 [Brevinematales bacterium]|nr:hypothetical protein [Brevinematales bacterium]
MSLKKAPKFVSLIIIVTVAVLTLLMYGILLGKIFSAFSDTLNSKDHSVMQDTGTSLVFSNGLSMYKDIRIARNGQSAIE